jgi:sacsin
VLHTPENAKGQLDRKRIPACNFRSLVVSSVFHTPGSFVHPKDHCYLQNSCYFEFFPGEHVGFEVIDDADKEETFLPENYIPVYVYGIIVREHVPEDRDEASDGGRFCRQFVVNLGKERGGHTTISVLRLYKLVRRTETALATSAETASEDGDADMPPEFKATLKEIRDHLREAWADLDDKADRRRVVKRLLLQWHPDKNPENKDYYTRVTQAIFTYIDLLDQGLPLPEDDDDEYRDIRDMADNFNRPGSTFSRDFFREMFTRGCRQAQSKRSPRKGRRKGGAHSSDREHNPQPGEGRRWIRQAVADIAVAHDAIRTREKGHNWICYLCHQVS